MDTEEYQQYAEAPRPGDDLIVPITARLAEKCAAIIRAYRDGQILYGEWIGDVVAYLSNSAFVVRVPGQERVVESTRLLAARIDSAPWPQPGGPRPQPL
ncbi:MAG TPA: hypothetical protein VIU87_07140 [Mycobacterium sp.]